MANQPFKFNIGDEVKVYEGWEQPVAHGTVTNRKHQTNRNESFNQYKLSRQDKIYNENELTLEGNDK